MDYIWYFFGVTAILILIFGMIIYDGEDSIPVHFLKCLFVSFFGGFFIGGLLFLFTSEFKTSNLKKQEIVCSTFEIVALEQNGQTEGGYQSVFFIGSGYIGEQEYYCFYKQYPNGDIKFEKVQAQNVFLNQSGDGNPRIIEYGQEYKDWEENKWLRSSERNCGTRTVLYIPQGTVKRNFKIN